MKLNRQTLRKMILKEIADINTFNSRAGDVDYSQSNLYGGNQNTQMHAERGTTISYIEQICKNMGFDQSMIRTHHYPDVTDVNCGGDLIAQINDSGLATLRPNMHRGSFTPQNFKQLELALSNMNMLEDIL